MARRIEYFYDYVSPYSYLADSQLEGLLERTGAELVYRPLFLGGVMNATGNSPPASVPAKGKYMAQDIARWLAKYDLPFTFNPAFPVNTVRVMRGALVTLEDGGFDRYHPAMFKAMWQDGVNLGDAAAIGEVLEKAGLAAQHILERAATPEIKDALRRNTDEAVARGSFGAPTFFVGDQLFWGNDRLDFAEAALLELPE